MTQDSLTTHNAQSPAEREEFVRRRRRRSVALGLVLAALVIIFYAITVVKLGPGVMNRPL